MKKINLEEILEKNYVTEKDLKGINTHDAILRAMKEACKQALELAAENAEIVHDTDYVDKDSIINTINQIE